MHTYCTSVRAVGWTLGSFWGKLNQSNPYTPVKQIASPWNQIKNQTKINKKGQKVHWYASSMHMKSSAPPSSFCTSIPVGSHHFTQSEQTETVQPRGENPALCSKPHSFSGPGSPHLNLAKALQDCLYFNIHTGRDYVNHSKQAVAAQPSEPFTPSLTALPTLLFHSWIWTPDPVISRKHLRTNPQNVHKRQMTDSHSAVHPEGPKGIWIQQCWMTASCNLSPAEHIQKRSCVFAM